MENERDYLHNYIFSSKFAEQTLNSLNECISMTDMEDYIIFINDAFERTYGFSKNELIGKNINIIRSNNNDPSITKNILPSTLKGSWVGRIYNKRKDGTEFLVSLRTGIVRNDLGEPIALVGSAIDLTETLLAEEKLQAAQDKYRALFNEIKDVVYESTPEGNLIDINASGIELFGYKNREEALSVNVTNGLYVFPEDRDKFKQLIEKYGFVKNYEILIKTKDNEHLIVLETAYANKNKDGKVISYRGILRDISDLKKTEQQLKNYVKELAKVNKQLLESEEELKNINHSKDRLFSIIGHDLRSPFTALIGFSDYLIEDIDELEKNEISLYARKINESAKNIFSLLENLLDWSRIETGRINPEYEEFSIKSIADTAIQLLKANAQNKNVEVINNIKNGVFVIADKNMISSAIRNILSNAIKFTLPGKQIVFESETTEKYATVSIKDEGVGMSAEVLNRLFDFRANHSTLGTRNEKGCGLGLIISKELVEKNGGKIFVESELNQGSKFSIMLLKAQV